MINLDLRVLCVQYSQGIHMEVCGKKKKAVLVRSPREMRTRNKSLDIIFIKMQDETTKENEKSHRGSSEVCICMHKKG